MHSMLIACAKRAKSSDQDEWLGVHQCKCDTSPLFKSNHVISREKTLDNFSFMITFSCIVGFCIHTHDPVPSLCSDPGDYDDPNNNTVLVAWYMPYSST